MTAAPRPSHDGTRQRGIGCAACVDGCNSVMAKIGAPLGLIRFSTEHAMASRYSLKQMQRHVLRPRVLIYTGLLLIVSVFFGTLFHAHAAQARHHA